MTKITVKGLLEEDNAITEFIYKRYHKEWLEFCVKERNGKQSLEELTMLVNSITGHEIDYPWRLVMSRKGLQEFLTSQIGEEKSNQIVDGLIELIKKTGVICGDA